VPQNTFPPKFSQNILYPAILNLDEIDMSGAPVGNIGLGTYFDIAFGDLPNNTVPYLSYGKHGFRVSMNADPISSGYPRLRPNSRVLFEFKDTNGLVLFSNTTPLHSADNLKFMGYVWIKPDPLRTYEHVTEGYGTMTIVGQTETNNPNWRGIYNVRSTISINIDSTTEVSNSDGTTQIYYNENISPIIFKNPNKMTSGSGALFISESIIPEHDEIVEISTNPSVFQTQTVAKQSIAHISASHLQTFSGKVSTINVDYWRSGSNDDWQILGNRPLINSNGTYYSEIFEEGIDVDYAEGINPISAEWQHELSPTITPSGQTTKMKFRLRFGNPIGSNALSVFPFSGSSSTSNEFILEYPEADNYWLNFDGSGMITPGTTTFASSNRMLLQTANGQFSFNQAPFSSLSGQTFDAGGEPLENEDGAVIWSPT